jgi:hypothetical protein
MQNKCVSSFQFSKHRRFVMKRLITSVWFIICTAVWMQASGRIIELPGNLNGQSPNTGLIIPQVSTQAGSLKKAGGPRILSNGVAIPSDFPEFETHQYGETEPGRLFISSTFFGDNSIGNYLVICDNGGLPYFYRRLDRFSDKGCADFKVQPNGLLSYHHYNAPESGFMVVMDHHYTPLDTFAAVGNYRTDNHDFLLLDNGHALLIAEEDKPMDMSKIIPGGQPNAVVIGNHIQEVDGEGNLYWEWKSWDHLNITDAIESLAGLKGNFVDYVHLNSIAIDYDGQYVISLRYYNEICKINAVTGEFIWQFGGKNNEFTFINEDTPFANQHHAMPVPGKPDHYTIFDNGHARAVEYRLDLNSKTAEKVWEYQYSKKRSSSMMGSVQRFPNGNTYIDWSDWPPLKACELDSEDNILFEMQVNGISGYRSFRFEWEGQMLKPDLIAENRSGQAVLIFNQFGDPDVDYYKIFHGLEPNPTVLLDTSRLTMKTFDQLDNKQIHYFRVTSVSRQGAESDTSNEAAVFIKNIPPGDNQLLNPDFSDSDRYWYIGMYGDLQVTGNVIDSAYQLKVTSITPGSGCYVYQFPVELLEDETYILEFDAWANKTLQMYPYVVSYNGNSDYSRIGAIQITTKHDHFSYSFTKKNTSTSEALVAFLIETVGELHVDNVILRQEMASNTDQQTGTQPARYRLEPNFPNPFNASTTIEFSIPVRSEVTLTLYDILGREVRQIRKADYMPGQYKVPFHGDLLSSGVYFYRIEASEIGGSQSFEKIRKMIYLK